MKYWNYFSLFSLLFSDCVCSALKICLCLPLHILEKTYFRCSCCSAILQMAKIFALHSLKLYYYFYSNILRLSICLSCCFRPHLQCITTTTTTTISKNQHIFHILLLFSSNLLLLKKNADADISNFRLRLPFYF